MSNRLSKPRFPLSPLYCDAEHGGEAFKECNVGLVELTFAWGVHFEDAVAPLLTADDDVQGALDTMFDQ
ncbi:hypothetical protein V7794_08575 [Rhizobium laguerreae]